MSLAIEYFLLVFAAAVGFIQFAAGRGGLKGLMFSQNPGFNRMLAAALALPPMIAFFTWNYRNPVGIIEGAQQAGLFTLAALSAVTLTLLLGSVLNHRRLSPAAPPGSGLEALKEITFFQALRSRCHWRS
jgi:hypothetical protein